MIFDRNKNKYFKMALHLHTTLSDGHKSPEEVVRIYKNAGYDAIVFTDHWYYGKEQVIDGVTVFSGCEYNIGKGDTIEGEIHILGIGMEYDPGIPRDATRKTAVEMINAAGGIAVLAHPAWSVNTLDDAKALPALRLTEIYNAVSEVGQSMRPYSDHFVDAAANAGIYYGILATDDAHYYDGIDNCRGFVMIKAESLSRESLVSALRRGEFYSSQGPSLFARREGKKIVIDTSPASVIATLSSRAWMPDRVLRGEGLTHFEYTPNESEKWIRVEVRDAEDKRAWSNIFVLC